MTGQDVERVLAIAACLPQAPHWTALAYQTALDPEAALPRVALVAECEQVVVAFAVASVTPPQAELESIAVAASTQRQGVARELLAALEEELLQRDVTEVLLEVRVSNQPALELYGAFGFEPTAVRARYYVDPVEDAVLMLHKIQGIVVPRSRVGRDPQP
jgi:ribosomal-protein-alanine N-acetyltransferase